MKQRKTIAVDIDDVLARSAEGFVAFTNQRWNMRLSPDDYREEWAVVWGVPLAEALRRSEEYHASGAAGRYEPHQTALPVLRQLSKKYKLVAVTSRRAILRPETDQWMERHFPGVFKDLYYAGIWDRKLSGQRVVGQALAHTKAEICREIAADFLIDDQIKHCVGAAEAGLTALLFGDYGWNRAPGHLPARVVRVRGWNDVAEYFGVEG